MPATTTGRIAFYHHPQSRAAIAHGMLGKRFSAADVYIGAELSWAAMFGLPQLRQNAAIDEYIARCRERPAYARTMGAR